jgi:hypothetical protein
MSMAKELKTMRIWRFPKLAKMAILPREKKETIDEFVYQAGMGIFGIPKIHSENTLIID